MLPKASAYVKSYDGQTKWMYFLILFRKNMNIWDKVSADIKKGFDSEPVYCKKFLKTKKKSQSGEDADFYNKEIPQVEFNNTKVDSNHTSLTVIGLDSALKKDEDFCLQPFLKEYKYIEKKVIKQFQQFFFF